MRTREDTYVCEGGRRCATHAETCFPERWPLPSRTQRTPSSWHDDHQTDNHNAGNNAGNAVRRAAPSAALGRADSIGGKSVTWTGRAMFLTLSSPPASKGSVAVLLLNCFEICKCHRGQPALQGEPFPHFLRPVSLRTLAEFSPVQPGDYFREGV